MVIDATAFSLLSSFLTNLIRTSEIFKRLYLLMQVVLLVYILLYNFSFFKWELKIFCKILKFFQKYGFFCPLKHILCHGKNVLARL